MKNLFFISIAFISLFTYSKDDGFSAKKMLKVDHATKKIDLLKESRRCYINSRDSKALRECAKTRKLKSGKIDIELEAGYEKLEMRERRKADANKKTKK